MHNLGTGDVILGDWEASQAPFWVLWRSLGYLFGGFGSRLGSIFGGSGGPLGSILEALGVPWLPLGVLGGALGRPRGPKSNFPNFFPPILRLFWLHFGGKNRSKI